MYTADCSLPGSGMSPTGVKVAATALWLCSEQSSFVTGAVIPIDGGQSAGLKPRRVYRQGEGMGRGD